MTGSPELETWADVVTEMHRNGSDLSSWVKYLQRAAGLFTWNRWAVPAVLQTPGYTRAVLDELSAGAPENESKVAVNSAMARLVLDNVWGQRHYLSEHSLTAAPYNDTAALTEELSHLLYLADRPPFGVGLHVVLNDGLAALPEAAQRYSLSWVSYSDKAAPHGINRHALVEDRVGLVADIDAEAAMDETWGVIDDVALSERHTRAWIQDQLARQDR